MWILKLHIAISILCCLNTVAMKIIFKEQYERYGTIKKRWNAEKNCNIPLSRIQCFSCIYICCNGIPARRNGRKIKKGGRK